MTRCSSRGGARDSKKRGSQCCRCAEEWKVTWNLQHSGGADKGMVNRRAAQAVQLGLENWRMATAMDSVADSPTTEEKVTRRNSTN